MKHFFSENRNNVVVIIVNEICMGVEGLVGAAAVDLRAVASGVNLETVSFIGRGWIQHGNGEWLLLGDGPGQRWSPCEGSP